MTGARFAATISRVARLGVLIALAGAAAAIVPDTISAAERDKTGECLTGPKGTPPQGERWYYRVERGTKRQCWYTRAGTSTRKAVAQAPQANEPLKAPDEPLQLSVANARAEADLSVPPRPSLAATPRDTPPRSEKDRPWTLAERWSDYRDAPQPYQPPPMYVTQPPQNIQPEPPNDAEDLASTNMLDIAAGALGLVGLATTIIALLIRRRRQDEPEASWHFSQRSVDGVRPRLPLPNA